MLHVHTIPSTDHDYHAYNGEEIHQDIEVTYTPTVQSTEPYQFKATGEVGGDRESIELVGGSVTWNQLAYNPNFESTNGWAGRYATVSGVSGGAITLTVDSDGTSRGLIASLPSNAPFTQTTHKYLISIDAKVPISTRLGLSCLGGSGSYRSVVANTWTSVAVVWSPPLENTYRSMLYALVDGSLATGEEMHFRNAQIIDLTAMFGTTIADYIYTLEQGQAGAGVAWFKKLFPKPYYAYNAGELMSVQAASHDMVGFNAWDEEWELGQYSTSTGNKTSSNTAIRCKNKIPILPNTQYYFQFSSGSMNCICFYDANEEFISGSAIGISSPQVRVSPSNAYYLAFQMNDVYGTTYNNDICINISWDGERNGEYEPYVEHSYPLDASVTLRGIPKLANGKLYYDGDTYRSDGLHTENYVLVELGSLNWVNTQTATDSQGRTVHYTSANAWTQFKPAGTGGLGLKNAISSIGKQERPIPIAQIDVSEIAYTLGNTINGDIWFLFTDQARTAEQVKTFLNGHKIVVELATPTTSYAEPFESIQEVTPNYGTEEFLTTSIVPVGNNTQYYTREIYGGTLDLVSGVLTVTHGYIASYNGETLPSTWISDRDVYASGTTPTTGAQVVYELAEPQTYQLTPQQINAFIGQNNIWADSGEVEVVFTKSIPQSGSFEYPLEGEYTIEYGAIDACGNVSEADRTVYVGVYPAVPS